MNWLPTSIRWRIQVWHGLLLLVVLAGFGLTALELQKIEMQRRVDGQLGIVLSYLHDGLEMGRPGGAGRPPERREDAVMDFLLGVPLDDNRRPLHERPGGKGKGKAGAPPQDFKLPDQHVAKFSGPNGFYYATWNRDGGSFGRSANTPADVARPAVDSPGALAVTWESRGVNREAFLFTPPGECLLVGRSMSADMQAIARMAWWYTGIGGIVLALGLAGGWWLASRAIRPVEKISAAATRIAQGHLSERIDVKNTDDELGSLAAVLNDTFAKLDASFAQQARFTADAAHELRTPLTVVLTQAQLALARERGAAEYRETIESCQRAAKRMQGLVESLLELSKLDATTKPDLRPCDLATISRDNIDLIRPLADEHRIQLKSNLQPTPCSADQKRIAQVLTNLLSNAVKYSRAGDEITISTHRENGSALITVADTGPGIGSAHLPHLFDRFYRADDSRNRATGGAGLGLAICKSIAEAHGGTITVESELERGTKFTLRIPAGNQSSQC